MLLMALGSMLVNGGGFIGLVAAPVRSHTLTPMEDLHRGHRGPDLHPLPGQRVGDAVVVALELHVVVDVDARRRPLMEFVALTGQRYESRPVQLLKQTRSAAGALAKRPLVELGEQLPDRLIEFCQSEELAMPQCR